jgi:hypothetical protein
MTTNHLHSIDKSHSRQRKVFVMTSIAASDCFDNLDNGVANLLAVYAQATPEEITAGLNWYRIAYDEAVRIGKAYDVELLTVVQVACALSPRLSWEQNMPAAESVIRYYVAGGYVPSITPYANKEMNLQRTHHTMEQEVIADDTRMNCKAPGPTKVNIIKALWVLQGHVWVLRGPKVNSFCDNILFHDKSDAVTVDSHAIQCWLGRMVAGTYTVSEQYYAILAEDYRKAARIVGITPLQFQAVTWLTKKRLSPRR